MANHNPPTNGFKPGVSGNPKGKPPKDWTWAGLIEQVAEELDAEGTPLKLKMVRAVTRKAVQGDVQAFKELSNRTDGMPVQKTEQEVKMTVDQEQQDIAGVAIKAFLAGRKSKE